MLCLVSYEYTLVHLAYEGGYINLTLRSCITNLVNLVWHWNYMEVHFESVKLDYNIL